MEKGLKYWKKNAEEDYMKTLIEKMKALRIYAVMCRFLFIITIPIWCVNLLFGIFMLLPYWILTGKVFFETKMFQSFIDWHNRLY